MTADNEAALFKPDLGPVIDPRCQPSIETSSRVTKWGEAEFVAVTQQCQRCSSCVVDLAFLVGSPAHMARIAESFCAPGEAQDL